MEEALKKQFSQVQAPFYAVAVGLAMKHIG